MVSAIVSASAALTILQAQRSPNATPALQDQDLPGPSIDPRSTHRMPVQSLDALLRLRADLRQDRGAESKASQELLPTSNGGIPGQSGMLAVWAKTPTVPGQSRLDAWREIMNLLQAHPEDKIHPQVPLDSPLSPWQSSDVIQQLKDMDKYIDRSSRAHRAFIGNDAAIYEGMARTPPEDVARMRTAGATVWYEYAHFSDPISDQEFNRNIKNYALYGTALVDPINPENALSQAFLNGTAQIIRGSKIPEFYDRYFSYSMYSSSSKSDQYKWIGGWDRNETNTAQIAADLRKKNPTMNVAIIGADGDVAFILYPKTTSATPAATAVAQGSVAATGAKPSAATAR